MPLFSTENPQVRLWWCWCCYSCYPVEKVDSPFFLSSGNNSPTRVCESFHFFLNIYLSTSPIYVPIRFLFESWHWKCNDSPQCTILHKPLWLSHRSDVNTEALILAILPRRTQYRLTYIPSNAVPLIRAYISRCNATDVTFGIAYGIGKSDTFFII